MQLKKCVNYFVCTLCVKVNSFLTKGNGSRSSFVKQLKGYNEESVRCAQH